jgi:hypothetical protein
MVSNQAYLLQGEVIMIVTKQFSNSFGKPIQLSRKQYQTKWVGHMCQAYDIFIDASMDKIFTEIIMPKVEEAAGIAWDVHSLQGAEVE